LDTDISTVYSAVNGIANGTNSLANVSITGGGIDNVTIGATTAANGTFSNLTATTSRVGNVATGTWNATAIDVAHGGTGLTSTPANGALDIGNGTGFTRTTLTAGSNITITNGVGSITIASSGGGGGSGTVTSVNVSGGTTGLTYSGGPVTTSGTITMAGTLVVGNGGTGVTTLTANSVVLGNGTGAVQVVAPGTSGNVLTSNGTTWSSSAASGGTNIANGTSNVSIATSGGNITMQTAGTSAVIVDTSQNLQFNSGYGSIATAYGCRAWVNFNGTGTVAIRASGNVSSITDNGTGDYTVNFTTAMSDANYSWSYGSQYANTGGVTRQNIFPMMSDGASLVLAGSLRFYTGTTSAVFDSSIITASIFR
jgi:hypothetical protein